MPDQPLKKQLDDMYTITRKAITNTDALHNRKYNNIARKKQPQLINKAPKKAHKEIFKDKNAQPWASLQAVKDPETGRIETEPTKQAQIFEKYFEDSWQAINIEHGTYLLKKHLETTHGNTQRTSKEVNLQTPLNYKLMSSVWNTWTQVLEV